MLIQTQFGVITVDVTLILKKFPFKDELMKWAMQYGRIVLKGGRFIYHFVTLK